MSTPQPTPVSRSYARIPLLLILLLALLLRLPYLFSGLPYLYDEDEAHHLNRVFEMAKTNDLNPHYFHKPSLHFYLRLPVIYGMIAYKKMRGEMRSSKNIRTRDEFGLAGYAFSASHPSLAIGARAVSLALSIGIVLLTFLVIRALALSSLLAYFGALLCAIAPPLIEHSCLVAVDTPMAFFCLAGTLSAISAVKKFSLQKLFWCGFLCGLAISTKYNAAPIAILPLLVWWCTARASKKALFIACGAPALAFFAASPFIVIEYAAFWQQLSYEIWHYSVAGHEGNSGERGLPQLIFYLSWFMHDGVGYVVLLLALGGLVATIKDKTKNALLLISFPLLYLLLMVLQKVNFTRNMVVMIPYLVIIASYGVAKLNSKKAQGMLLALALLQPFMHTLRHLEEALSIPESRHALEQYSKEAHASHPDLAISGALQPALTLSGVPGSSVINLDKITPLQLYNHGFDWLALPGDQLSPLHTDSYALTRIIQFSGVPLARVVQNPRIDLLAFDTEAMNAIVQATIASPPMSLPFNADTDPGETRLCPESKEGCVLSTRFTPLQIQTEDTLALTNSLTLSLTLFTPWEDQTVRICQHTICTEPVTLHSGKAEVIRFDLRAPMALKNTLFLYLTRVSSPREHGRGTERRRIGAILSKASLYKK